MLGARSDPVVSNGEYTSDCTYAYMQIKFRAIGIGSSEDIYGRLKLIVPTHLLVDHENAVQAVFELEGIVGLVHGLLSTLLLSMKPLIIQMNLRFIQ
jgi:hypothetical protein